MNSPALPIVVKHAYDSISFPVLWLVPVKSTNITLAGRIRHVQGPSQNWGL